MESVKTEATNYQEFIEHGGEWIGEQDEEGNLLWDQATVLDMHIEAREEALMDLRKAFVMALYHHWERAIQTATGGKPGNHKGLVKLANEKGISLHPRLASILALANTLKHNSDKYGTALCQSWSDVFGAHFRPRPEGKTDWYAAIRLTDAHILEVSDIVAASGP